MHREKQQFWKTASFISKKLHTQTHTYQLKSNSANLGVHFCPSAERPVDTAFCRLQWKVLRDA